MLIQCVDLWRNRKFEEIVKFYCLQVWPAFKLILKITIIIVITMYSQWLITFSIKHWVKKTTKLKLKSLDYLALRCFASLMPINRFKKIYMITTKLRRMYSTEQNDINKSMFVMFPHNADVCYFNYHIRASFKNFFWLNGLADFWSYTLFI